MFISKSKKLVKPKAPSHRGAGAATTGDHSQEPTSTQRPAESERRIPEEEAEDGSGAELFVVQPAPTSTSTLGKRKKGPTLQERGDSTTSVAEVDVRRDSEVLTRTRSGKRGENTTVLPHVAAGSGEVGVQEQTPIETVTDVTDSGVLLTPSATQVTARGYVRKSKKPINPKAQNRRQHTEAAQAVHQNGAVDSAVDSTNSTNPIVADEQAHIDDVSQRLLAALSNHEEQPIYTDTASSEQIAVPPEPANAANESILQSNDASDNVENITEAAPTSIQRPSRKRKQATLEVEDGQDTTSSVKSKRARAKKSGSRSTSLKPTNDFSAEVNEDEDQPTLQKVKGRKRKRGSTSEDAASHKIEPAEVRMEELIADTHHGKISQREQLLRQRDVEMKEHKLKAAQALAREQLQEVMAEGDTVNQPEPIATPSTSIRPSKSPSPDTIVAAPQFRIVNGQIVADESSRIIDRRAERTRAAEAPDDTATVIEEDNLTRRTNSRSFTKYDKPTRWSPAATELFYKGLQYFGLEFSMMACLFPGRSRRQLKAKFIREERADVAHVNALLKDRKPIPSREELEIMMGKKLKDPEELAEELRLQREVLEEAQRVEDERAEERRLAREKGAEEEGRRVRDRDDDDDEEEEEEDVEENDDEEEEGNENRDTNGGEQEEEEQGEEEDLG